MKIFHSGFVRRMEDIEELALSYFILKRIHNRRKKRNKHVWVRRFLTDREHKGSNNDSGILANSNFGKKFLQGEMGVMAATNLQGCAYDPLPYFLVGDEIFPLKTWLMRPYGGKNLTEGQRIFNYRLSRARRTIENAFGILVARWRIFHTPIKASVENAQKYILAAIALHNYLGQTENASYCPYGFVDSDCGNGQIHPGDWRSTQSSCLQQLSNVRGSRYEEDAKEMGEALKDYLNSEEGSMEWQVEYIRRT